MNERESRLEDKGVMRLISYWPILVCIFTGGAWYQSTHALSSIVEKDEQRISNVETAVVYLKTLVELRETERHERANRG